jgi:hypothetical protein
MKEIFIKYISVDYRRDDIDKVAQKNKKAPNEIAVYHRTLRRGHCSKA